jgi:hypothetical protein
MNDGQLIVRMTAGKLHINTKTVRFILIYKLRIKNDCAKNDEWLNIIIIEDENWVFQRDSEMKRQSMQWKTPGSPRPKEGRISESRQHLYL